MSDMLSCIFIIGLPLWAAIVFLVIEWAMGQRGKKYDGNIG